MNSNSSPIPGGCILLARKMLDSDLMDHSSLVVKLWVWLLLKANWKDRAQLRRGQLVTTIAEMQEAMGHYSGWRKMRPSPDQIRSAYGVLTGTARVTIRRTTRGMIITILNYEAFQDIRAYASHTESREGIATCPAAIPHDTEEGEIQKKKKPSSPDGEAGEYFLTKKKKRLEGRRLEAFMQFWEAFGYKSGKADAADAWLEIPELTAAIVAQIVKAAQAEAAARPALRAAGKTPKMAQGWISSRRWEDERPTETAGTPEAAPVLSAAEIADKERRRLRRIELGIE